MTPDEAVALSMQLAADRTRLLLDTPKQCSRCPFEGTGKDFPIVVVRGAVALRSWCNNCLHTYYAAYQRLAEKRRKEQRLDLIRERHETLQAKREGAAS